MSNRDLYLMTQALEVAALSSIPITLWEKGDLEGLTETTECPSPEMAYFHTTSWFITLN